MDGVVEVEAGLDVEGRRLEEMRARGGLKAKKRCRRLGSVLARLTYCSVAAMVEVSVVRMSSMSFEMQAEKVTVKRVPRLDPFLKSRAALFASHPRPMYVFVLCCHSTRLMQFLYEVASSGR